MENTPYFSFRINVAEGTRPIRLEQIVAFLARYKCCLVAFEEADNKVKNNHIHGLIWNEVVVEDDFVKRLKLEIPTVSGNGRFAICETELKGKSFHKACCYVCKGLRERMPVIALNTSFTQPEIEAFWLEYWGQMTKLVKKAQEDTSQRMIPRLWEKWGAHVQMNCDTRYKRFMEWRSICLDEWKTEMKPYDTDSFMKVVMGLMLQTDSYDFDSATLDKHLKIAGFSNAAIKFYEEKDTM